MSPIKNFPSPKLADKKRDRAGFLNFWLEIGKKIPFWSKMSNLYQKGKFLTLWANGIFFNQVFWDSPVNFGIVGQIISECTRPQTADQPANCSDVHVKTKIWKHVFFKFHLRFYGEFLYLRPPLPFLNIKKPTMVFLDSGGHQETGCEEKLKKCVFQILVLKAHYFFFKGHTHASIKERILAQIQAGSG